MHFWINKGSQGVGLNGRYVHPSIFAGTRRPKSMVTPVHRFQSIESVASGGHRHPRPPVSHARFPVPVSIHIQNSIAAGQATHLPGGGGRTATSGGRNCTNGRASQAGVGLANGQTTTTLTPTEHGHPPASKLKCFVWIIIIIIPFFIIGANYTNGGYIAYCGLFLLVLLVGGFVSLFELIGSSHIRHGSLHLPPPVLQTPADLEQLEGFDIIDYVSTHNQQMHASEFGSVRIDPNEDDMTKLHSEPPPPPYNIAIMIPSHTERLSGMQDSPPPTYEKAIN